ncbi:MAG TPA: hypothetical protein VMS22_02140 [Candidatus Eisenbacteria bacterium]|nr:hypothetical protein [Candidatus Eisenbacteria bacterium]
MARLLAVALAIGVAAASADAAGLCGYAYNFANEAQAKVRLKRYHAGEGTVDARLVCTKWKTICNGKAGAIHARQDTESGFVPVLHGTLSYGKRLTCGGFCQIDGAVEAPNMLFCQFNCPPGKDVITQVSFTVGPHVCQ